jgi:hypothetical protein
MMLLIGFFFLLKCELFCLPSHPHLQFLLLVFRISLGLDLPINLETLQIQIPQHDQRLEHQILPIPGVSINLF